MPRIVPAALACAASLLLLASPARAAEGEGLYIGAGAGYVASDYPAHAGESGGSGVRGSLFVGYGVLLDRLYLGLEGGYGTGGATVRFPPSVSSPSATLTEIQDFNLSSRIGFVIRPGLVVYGTAGYEGLQVRGRMDPSRTASLLVGHDYLSGLRTGLGIEAAVTGNLFMRGEYTHSWISRDGLPGTVQRGTTVFGLGYRF